MSIVERDGTMLIKRLSGMIAAMVLLFGISGVLTTASASGFFTAAKKELKQECPSCNEGTTIDQVVNQNSNDSQNDPPSCDLRHAALIFVLMVYAKNNIPSSEEWGESAWRGYLSAGGESFVESEEASCFHPSQLGNYYGHVDKIITEAAASAAAAE